MRCQICYKLGGLGIDYEETAQNEMRSHSEIHRMQMNDDADDWETIFRFCFSNTAGEGFGGEEDVGIPKEEITDEKLDEGKRLITSNSTDIDDHCRNVILNNFPDGHIFCSLCTFQWNASARFVDKSIDHAFIHYDKRLFTCGHCKYKTKSPFSLKSHVTAVHHLTKSCGYYLNENGIDGDEIKKLIDRCYAKKRFGKSIGIKKGNHLKIKTSAFGSKTAMHRRFRQAYKKFGRDRKMVCRLCSEEIYCGKIGSGAAIDHITGWHFEKNLYICRYCPTEYKTRETMVTHIKMRHQKTAIDGYDDHMKKYETEISALLMECFGTEKKRKMEQDLNDGQAKKFKPARKIFNFKETENKNGANDREMEGIEIKDGNQNKIEVSTRGRSTIQNAMQRHFNQLYAKFGRDRKIFCRLCSKDVNCGHGGSARAMDHATGIHFGSILFTCRYCPKVSKMRKAMTAHIITRHQTTAVGGYDDLGQKYESEIKALLTKCYGTEDEKETNQNDDDGGAKEMISTKKVENENRDQMGDEEKNGDTIPKPETNAAGVSDTENFRYYCDSCDFSTEFEELIQKHVALRHRR